MPEGIAISRYVRMAPRKARRVAELIQGKGVDEALNILHFTPKAASEPLSKTIRSAIANVIHKEGSGHVDIDEYIIKRTAVDGGPTMRRFRAGPMGRAMRIRKRSCHITVVVGEPEVKLIHKGV